MVLQELADKDGGRQTDNNNAVTPSERNNSPLEQNTKTNVARRDVSDAVTLGEMVGESGGKHSTMATFLVMVAMMVATSKAAFIDKRPKMPR